MNCLTRWAARDDREETRQIIIVGEIEPRWEIDRWIWEPGQQLWYYPINSTATNMGPGCKKKVKVQVTPFE